MWTFNEVCVPIIMRVWFDATGIHCPKLEVSKPSIQGNISYAAGDILAVLHHWRPGLTKWAWILLWPLMNWVAISHSSGHPSTLDPLSILEVSKSQVPYPMLLSQHPSVNQQDMEHAIGGYWWIVPREPMVQKPWFSGFIHPKSKGSSWFLNICHRFFVHPHVQTICPKLVDSCWFYHI